MTTAIKIYTSLSVNNVIEKVKKVSVAEIERNFKRYAKTYRLAYGKYPEHRSLEIELNQYSGVSMRHLTNWLKELENDTK